VAVLVDHVRHHVDHRLRKALGPAGAEHLGRTVAAERPAQLDGQILAPDYHGVAATANLGRPRGAL